jgi:hypothetical protein
MLGLVHSQGEMMSTDKTLHQLRSPRPRKVFLVNRDPHKLTGGQLSRLKRCFPHEEVDIVRIDFPPKTDPLGTEAEKNLLPIWYAHVNYCKENLNKKKDVIVLTSERDAVHWAGIMLMAAIEGYIHLIIKSGGEIAELTTIKIESRPFP